MATSPTPLQAPARQRTSRGRAALVLALTALTALVVAAAAWWGFARTPPPPPPVSAVTIALPTQINSAPMIVAEAQGLFAQAGVPVTSQPFMLGKDALRSVIDGRADLAVVADTPFMFALNGGQDLAIVAGISQARRALAIVARAERGVRRVEDLRGKSIALTMGTNFPYFLEAVLQVHGIASEQVSLVDLKTDAVIAAFTEGRVDAAVVFQPQLAQLQAALGDQVVAFHGEDAYAFRFLLVGKPAWIDGHPQEVQRILKALIAANRSIREHPGAARRAVGQVVRVDDAVMARLFDPEDYVVTLDQAMLLALDDQTRWAMKRGLVKPGPIPNYLNAMHFAGLEAVQPAAIRLAH